MSKVIDFKQLLPTPTVEDPYVQIDWIFNDKASTFQNKHTSKNYLDGCKLYKRFLRETDNYSKPKPNDKRFFIKEEWDKLALVKLKRWIDTTNLPQKDNYLTSHSMVTLCGAVRQTMLHAYENYHINEVVINVASAAPKRESNIRSAFSEEELSAIFKYLLPEIQFSESLLKPYKRTNKGRDPRVKFSPRNNFHNGPNYNEGWRCPIPDADGTGHVLSDDNARWYFENVMNCVPLSSARENAKEHKAFFQAISALFGGVYDTYGRWGVTPFIGTRVIMPLVVKLISETGLNVESVFSLKRDCLKEAHPLTGLPYIEYEKARSGGQKELHLAILELESANDEILALGQKQSVIVSNTINALLKLTEPLVEKVVEEDRNYLLLYEKREKKDLGKVEKLNNTTAIEWTQQFVKENNLIGDNGNRLIFALSRFRPTKFTQLIKKGYDILKIMQLAGHSSLKTTLNYIDQQQTTPEFHRSVEGAMINISKNRKELHKSRELPVLNQSVQNSSAQTVFQGTFCGCKNPYDPPAQVRNSKNYHAGDACTYFNMCLPCRNVLIAEKDLPKLIIYRAEIEKALNLGVQDMPRQGELYLKNLSILDKILTPDVEFSSKIISQAHAIAGEIGQIDMIDPFIF